MSASTSFPDLQAFQQSIERLNATLEITNREINNAVGAQRSNFFECEPKLVAETDEETIMGSIVTCYNKAKVVLAETMVLHADIELRRRQEQLEKSTRRLQGRNFELRRLQRSIEAPALGQPQLNETTPEQSQPHSIPNTSSAQPIVNSTMSEVHSPPARKRIRISSESVQATDVHQFSGERDHIERHHSSIARKNVKVLSAHKTGTERYQCNTTCNLTEPCSSTTVGKEMRLPSSSKRANEKMRSDSVSHQTKSRHSSAVGNKIKLPSSSKQAIKKPHSDLERNLSMPCHSSAVGKQFKFPSANKQATENIESVTVNTPTISCHSATVYKQNKLSSASKQPIKKLHSEPESNLTEPCHSSAVSKKLKLSSASKQATEKTESVTRSTPTECCHLSKVTKKQLPFSSKPAITKPHSAHKNNLIEPCHSSVVGKKLNLPSTNKPATEKTATVTVTTPTECCQSKNIEKNIKLAATSKLDPRNAAIKGTTRLPCKTEKSKKEKTVSRSNKTESIDSTSVETKIPSENAGVAEVKFTKCTDNEQSGPKNEEFRVPENPDANAKTLMGNTISKLKLHSAKASDKETTSTTSNKTDIYPTIDKDKAVAPSLKQTREEIIAMITSLQEETAVAGTSLGFNIEQKKNSAKKVKIAPFIPHKSCSIPLTKVAKKSKTPFGMRNCTDVAEISQPPKTTQFSMVKHNTSASKGKSYNIPLDMTNTSTQKLDKLEKSPSLAKNSAIPKKTKKSPPFIKPRTETMLSIATQKAPESAPSVIEPLTIPPFVFFSHRLKDIEISSRNNTIETGELFKEKLTPALNKKPTSTLTKQSLSLCKESNIISDEHLTRF